MACCTSIPALDKPKVNVGRTLAGVLSEECQSPQSRRPRISDVDPVVAALIGLVLGALVGIWVGGRMNKRNEEEQEEDASD